MVEDRLDVLESDLPTEMEFLDSLGNVSPGHLDNGGSFVQKKGNLAHGKQQEIRNKLGMISTYTTIKHMDGEETDQLQIKAINKLFKLYPTQKDFLKTELKNIIQKEKEEGFNSISEQAVNTVFDED